MRYLWKGMVIGALAGAAAGAGLDRRSDATTPVTGVDRTAERVRHGVHDTVERVRQVDVPAAVSEAATSARHRVAELADSTAVGTIRDKAAQSAAGVGDLADAVKDQASRAAAGAKDAGGATVSGLSGR